MQKKYDMQNHDMDYVLKSQKYLKDQVNAKDVGSLKRQLFMKSVSQKNAEEHSKRRVNK